MTQDLVAAMKANTVLSEGAGITGKKGQAFDWSARDLLMGTPATHQPIDVDALSKVNSAIEVLGTNAPA